MVCTAAAGQIIYVDADAPTGNGGSSWNDAYKYLQDALWNDQSGDEIRVAGGVYKPDQDEGGKVTPGDRFASFGQQGLGIDINDLTLRGGYRGAYDGTGLPANDRDIEAFETILSGDLAGNDGLVGDPCDLLNDPNRAENSCLILNVYRDTNEPAVLDGFTITGAYNDAGGGCGGGMYNEGSGILTVTDCTFRDNLAREVGGGMCNWGSNPTLINCTFSGNIAKEGGAMLNRDSTGPTLTNCTFNGNIAYAISGFYDAAGGGMSNYDSNPTLINCTFSGNVAKDRDYNDWGQGGGMRNVGASPKLINCTFIGNMALDGGGMCNWGAEPNDFCMLELINCTFQNNEARDGWRDTGNHEGKGGAMYNQKSLLKLANCTFICNNARDDDGYGGHGGGIYNYYNTSAELVNCIFSGNLASGIGGGFGGGMHNTGSSSSELVNCTFSDNMAINGGGIYIAAATGSSATITNCILWDDMPEEIFFASPNDANVSYSDIESWPPGVGTGNINEDPCFVDSGNEDYRLSCASPCIDTGDNTAVPEDYADLDGDGNTIEQTPWDLDGRPRVGDGDCNDTHIVDMGAYEFGWAYMGDFDGGCYIDFVDFSVLALTWMLEEGQAGYDPNCDISLPADKYIDWLDLDVFTDNWLLGVE